MFNPFEPLADIWADMFRNSESTNMVDRTAIGQEMSAPSEDPFAQSYERILAIQQQGSRGFRTFDIDPSECDQVDFPSVIQQAVLGNIFGFQTQANAFVTGHACDSEVNPGWRSIEITANGTWIKFEFLPPRVNWSSPVFSPGPSNAKPIEGDSWSPPFADPLGTGNTSHGPNTIANVMMNQNVILQLEETTASPIILKHGDVIRSPFNTIFLTFKQWTQRFRITVGYNTEINSVDQRMIGTRPAFFGANGLLSNSSIQYKPFSISSGDVNGTDINILNATSLVPFQTTLVYNPPLSWVPNQFPNPDDNGSGYLFLERLRVSATSISGSGAMIAGLFVELFIEGFSSMATLKPIKRRLMSVNLMFDLSSTSGRDARLAEAVSNELVRCRLGATDRLVLRASVLGSGGSSVASCNFQFAVEGYSLGGLFGVQVLPADRPITPFMVTQTCAEEQFQSEYDFDRAPGSR